MDLDRFFQTFADRFMEGDLAALAPLHVYPLVVYRPDGISVEHTPEDTVHALADCLMNLRANGARKACVQLDKIGLPQNERQPCDMTWQLLDESGQELGDLQLRYCCRLQDTEIRIELIDIVRTFQRVSFHVASIANH